MTYEYAVYFKLLLLCGYPDELQQYIDAALMEQDDLSDIILSLATAGSDPKVLLAVLGEYLLRPKDADIDYDGVVFDLVMSFLQKKYHEDSLPINAMTDLMYHLALHTGRYFDEPWSTMYLMDDYFGESEYVGKAEFLPKFEAFIDDKILFSAYPPVLPKETFFKKWLRQIAP